MIIIITTNIQNVIEEINVHHIGAIWGIKIHFTVILTWQVNVLFKLEFSLRVFAIYYNLV